MRQTLVLGGVGALVFLGVAVATLPAALLVDRLPAEIRVAGPSGSVWNGAADSLVVQGTPLGALAWQLQPAALLQGQLAYRIDVSRPDGHVRGRIAAGLGGVLTAEGLELQLPITALTPQYSANGWRGAVAGTVRAARLEGGWPVALAGTFTLSDLQAPGSSLSLGSYALDFDAGATTPAQLLGRVRDLAAPLIVRAQLTIRRDRSYVLEGEVTARPAAPPEVSTAIAFLGAPDAAGRRAFTISGTF